MISEGLEQLPLNLRRVFLLRYYYGLKIGPDDPNEAGDELSIAAQFDSSAPKRTFVERFTSTVPGLAARSKTHIFATPGDRAPTFDDSLSLRQPTIDFSRH